MEDGSAKDKPGGIVPTDSEAIAKSSASLTGRGLRSLSGWDATRVIEIGKELTSTHWTSHILQIIQSKLEEFLKPPIWSLLLVDGLNELHERAELYHYGRAPGMARSHRIKMGEGLIGRVAESRSSVVITDVQTNAAILAQMQEPQEKRAKSIIAVPLRFRDKCVGVIELIDCVGPGGFLQVDLSLLESLADFAAIALSNAKVLTDLEGLANTDEPTGLYKARYLDSWLELERGTYEASLDKYNAGDDFIYEFSLVCIVSDELKKLATSLSYAQYIQLLGEVGQRIKDSCCPSDHSHPDDHAFHCGEGKFYLTLPLHSKEQASDFACSFHKFFRETVWLQEQGLNVELDASIGVATCPEDGRTEAELLDSAEEAMNLVKSSTGDGVAAAKIGILFPPLF